MKIRRLGLSLFAIAALLGVTTGVWPTIARADIPSIQVSQTFTGTGTSNPLSLSGQNTCSIVVSGSGAGITLVPQVSSDYPTGSTWVTASGIGAGSISANGTYVGSIGQQGISAFRFNLSALSSGSLTAVVTCSPAIVAGVITSLPPVTVSGSPNVTVVNTPGVTVQNTPGVTVQNTAGVTVQNTPGVLVFNTAVATVAPTASAGVTAPGSAAPVLAYDACVPAPGATPNVTAGNSIVLSCDVHGVLNVNIVSAPPAPTVSPYAVGAGILVCPSTAPAASNSTYVATCNSSGFQNVFQSAAPSSTATSLPTATVAICASACTLYTVYITVSPSASSTVFLNIYNTPAASASLGTAVAADMVACAPGQTCAVFIPPTIGVSYSNAASAGCSTNFNGATFCAAGLVFMRVVY